MNDLRDYCGKSKRGFRSSFSGRLIKAFMVALIPVMLVAALPDAAKAEYAFFAEDGTPYWRAEKSAVRKRAVLDAADADVQSVRTNRAGRAPRSAARRGASGRQAASRPRLTPSAVRASRVRVASLSPEIYGPPAPLSAQPSITGGLVAWRASASCLAANLRGVIEQVAGYGSVTVNSTCRSRARNRRVGGAGKSWHLTGNAADIRIAGNWRAAAAYLRSSVGGFKHYGGGLFHIDNGPKRRF